MKLHTLTPALGSTKTRKRIGRGPGSGRGGTSTRGHKGAKSRSGYSQKEGFEGGQMPLQRRVPKFGFKNPFRVEYKAVNLYAVAELVTEKGLTEINPEVLQKHGIIGKKDKVKVLGTGELTTSVSISAHAFSNSAKAAVEAAGGTATVI